MLPVREVVERTLAGIVAAWPNNGLPLPDRQYIAAGLPQDTAWDCEQLTVAIAALPPQRVGAAPTFTQAGRTAQHGQHLRSATVTVELVRCHPTMDDDTLPDVEELLAAGLTQAEDLARMSDAIVTMLTSADPFPRAMCVLGPVLPTGVAGGFSGIAGSYTVDLLTWPGPWPE